jgi:hypothetical protein
MTIAEAREILGEEARGASDEEILQLIAQLERITESMREADFGWARTPERGDEPS